MMRIIPGDLSDPRVADLLRIHLTRARAETAPGSAHALYRGHGFVECEPFADYVPDRNSVFMSLDLRGSPNPPAR